jgi:PilZ domain-containing protein
MSDRRAEKRLEVCLDAVWDGTSGKHPARVTDLSEGGCYIDTLGDALVGEVLNVTLQLPNCDSLKLTGEVAHQMPPIGFGIRFVDLSSEQLEKIRSLLDNSKPVSFRF